MSVTIPLDKKAIFSPEEAEAYTGVDINRLWQMTNDPDCDFVIRDGKLMLFKRKQLMDYLKIKGPGLDMRRDTDFEVIAKDGCNAKMLGAMKEYKQLNRMLEENKGVLFRTQAVEAGIDTTIYYDFANRRNLKKADNGVYVVEELTADKYYMVHLSFEHAVFSHETALFFHGLIDKEPTPYSATTRFNCDAPRMKKNGIFVYTLPECLLKMGIMKMPTSYGNWIPVYDMERTICDIVHDRASERAEILKDVLKRYAAKENKSIGRLMRYAETFRIDNEMRELLMELSRKGDTKLWRAV